MHALLEFMLAALLILGGLFALIGSFGLARLSNFFQRLHAPTKIATFGIGCVLLAAVLHPLLRGQPPSAHEILISVFLFLTAPVGAHMLAKAALTRDPSQRPRLPPGNQNGEQEQADNGLD